MREAVIIEALRTPVGRYGGALASVRPDDLAAQVIRAVVARAAVSPADIEDVVFGCANQAGEDNRNVARMALLLAGLPVEVAGCTVNRLCGSGLEAAIQAGRAIQVGEGDLFVAGGVESMSRAPFVMGKPEAAYPRGNQTLYDTTLGWRFVNPRLSARHYPYSMGETAENVAERWHISREAQDEFALLSQQRAAAAIQSGRFKDEIVAVEVPQPKGPPLVVDTDEHPRADTTLAGLARLRPAFRRHAESSDSGAQAAVAVADGASVTAGNSSGINDGAAALVMASRDYADTHNLPVLARVVSAAVAGVDPAVMGVGPIPATRKALARAGLTAADMDLVELNEAFAAQSLAVVNDLGLDMAKVNVNGGAIALGHPLGASGARLLTTLTHELRRRGGRYGLATMCIGVGQGIAMIVENGER
ncbi:MAG: acetyl-CoA C-acyltransferase [Anaerolineae bacterium]